MKSHYQFSSVQYLKTDLSSIWKFASSPKNLKKITPDYMLFNITSNILDLGYFKNGLYNKLPEIIKKQLISQIPSKKLGNIKNIINAIHFLMKSEYVNGTKINIDGGI